MKKLIVCAAVLLAAMAIKAEVVSRDTIAYEGAVRMEKVEKVNDYGEVSVRYVAYLLDITNKKGQPRKVSTDRKTYESGEVTHVILNVQDSGASRIAKAINVNVQKSK